MPDSPEQQSAYAHAYDSHADLTTLMVGMGMFRPEERFDDELTLRLQSAVFLNQHAGVRDDVRAAKIAESIVPNLKAEQFYSEECIEGYLAARVVPKLAAKAMLHTGIHTGNYSAFNNLYAAYRSGVEVLSETQQKFANNQFISTVTYDTVHEADIAAISGTTQPLLAQQFAHTLRRLETRGLIGPLTYEMRMNEAGLKPAHRLLRKLRVR